MDGNNMLVCPESVVVLRTFADAIPRAVQGINESIERLVYTFFGVSDDLGEHAEDFKEMLMLIKNAGDEANEAFMFLPPKLNEAADRMDLYIRSNPTLPNYRG